MNCGHPIIATAPVRSSPGPRRAVRSTTRSRTSTTSSTRTTGKKLSRNPALRPNNFSRSSPGRICPAPCEASCTLQHRRQPGHHQGPSKCAIVRSRLGQWLGCSPRSLRPKSGKKVRDRRLRACPVFSRAAQQLRRAPDMTSMSTRRSPRLAVSLRLWHSRLQDGEAHHRPAAWRRWRPRAVHLPLTASMSAASRTGGARFRAETHETSTDAVALTGGGRSRAANLPIPRPRPSDGNSLRDGLPAPTKTAASSSEPANGRVQGHLLAEGKHGRP